MSIHVEGAPDHDRDTAFAGRGTGAGAVSETDSPPLLEAALEQVRLEGAIFFRSELTEGFAFESTPSALADALHPGAERVILFHIVARGSCWVAAADGSATGPAPVT
jgi:Cupin